LQPYSKKYAEFTLLVGFDGFDGSTRFLCFSGSQGGNFPGIPQGKDDHFHCLLVPIHTGFADFITVTRIEPGEIFTCFAEYSVCCGDRVVLWKTDHCFISAD
jgi:hypothetical protein